MALELCEYNFKDYEWIINNLDVYDFVKKQCYFKYKNYLGDTNNNTQPNTDSVLE